MILRPPRSTRTDTLFPYSTLFRSEIDLKLGSLFAPRRKDHAAIDRNPRLPEAQFAFLADVTVHLLALHRRAYEAAIGTESPSMIDEAMHSGVASVPHAYPHPTMWTYVQRNVNRTIRRPPYDHLILTHVANDIIARFRDLRLMSKH